MKSKWRYFFKPEILFLMGVVLANLPYIFWRFGYEMPPAYHFTISYIPLYLWFMGYIAFWFGAKSVPIFLLEKRKSVKIETSFAIGASLWRFCSISVIFLCVIQVILVIRLYGIIPIIGFFSEYDVKTLNLMQQEFAFGQLGLLSLTSFTLNALILVGIISDMRWNSRNRKILCAALIVSTIVTLFQGKTQGFFIFVFMLLTGSSLIKDHPFNPILEKLGFRKLSRKKTYFVIIILFIFLVLLHGFTRLLRVGAYKEFGIMETINAVIIYLSWPLMNMEEVVRIAGSISFQFDGGTLLVGLLPYRWRDKFQIINPLPLLEPTASSGFFGDIYWNLGLLGILVFSFFIGGLCKYFYINSRKSLFSLLIYSQIGWTLIFANTYNHFLNLIYIPVPAIIFFLLSKILRPKVSAESSQVGGNK